MLANLPASCAASASRRQSRRESNSLKRRQNEL